MQGGELAWEINLAGQNDLFLCSDPWSRSLYQGDGSGLQYSTLGLRKLDLDSGRQLARVRLGNQVRALAFADDSNQLFVATPDNLYRLDSLTLKILERWKGVLPSGCHTLLWHNGQLVAANYKSLGVFDPKTSKSFQKKAEPLTLLQSQGQLWSWTGAALQSFCPETGELGVLVTVQNCAARTLLISDRLWLHAPCDRPQYVSLSDFRSFGVCQIAHGQQVLPQQIVVELPAGIVIASALACEKAQMVLVVGAEWAPKCHRWRAVGLYSYGLPNLRPLGFMSLEPKDLSVFVCPSKGILLTSQASDQHVTKLCCRSLVPELAVEGWQSGESLSYPNSTQLTPYLASTFE